MNGLQKLFFTLQHYNKFFKLTAFTAVLTLSLIISDYAFTAVLTLSLIISDYVQFF